MTFHVRHIWFIQCDVKGPRCERELALGDCSDARPTVLAKLAGWQHAPKGACPTCQKHLATA